MSNGKVANTNLYNKYRPQTYKDVIGQEHITTLLKGLVKNNNFHSARGYIFYGPAGSGKTTSSRIFAKSINCLNPKDGEACNECEHCQQFNKNSYPDFIEKDGASYYKVDQIKQLLNIAQTHPIVKNGWRIILIDEAHRLSKEAWDTMLKFLEESEARTIFMFATTEPDKIREAIASRCYIFGVRPLTPQEISQELQRICKSENIEYSQEAIDTIAYAYQGKMRDALKILDQHIKAFGHLKEIYINSIDQTILEIIKLSYFNKLEEAFTLLDRTVGVNINIRELFSRVMLALYMYPNHIQIGIPEEELEAVADLLPKENIKKIIDTFISLFPETTYDIKTFLVYISGYGVQVKSTKQESTQIKRKFRPKFAKLNLEGGANDESLKKEEQSNSEKKHSISGLTKETAFNLLAKFNFTRKGD